MMPRREHNGRPVRRMETDLERQPPEVGAETRETPDRIERKSRASSSRLRMAFSGLAGVVILALAPEVSLHADIPHLLHYQGRILTEGVNFEGEGGFKFSLVNGSGTVTHWSHDGTGSEGAAPETSISIPVANGIYSIVLGDTTLANMSELDPSVFDHADVALRVWFDDGAHGFELLTPDQRITAVGFAFAARTVPDGSITTDKIGDEVITGEKMARDLRLDGSLRADELRADSQIETVQLKATKVVALEFEGDNLRLNGTAAVRDGLGVGIANPRTVLHVAEAVSPGNRPENHVVFIENTLAGDGANGLAIKLNNDQRNGVPSTVNLSNNYITFYNSSEEIGDTDIAGRIEGMSAIDAELLKVEMKAALAKTAMTPFELYQFKLSLHANPDFFSPGLLPTADFDPGAFPSLELGPSRLPSANFSRGALPSLSFSGGARPSAVFSDGSLPSLTFDNGKLPSISFSMLTFNPGKAPTATLDPGELPDLTFTRGALPTASLQRGSLPSLSFDAGQFSRPTLQSGKLPALSFSGGKLPSVNGPAVIVDEAEFLLRDDVIEQIVNSFNKNFQNAEVAWGMIRDPLAAAIKESAIVCEGGGVTYESGSGDYAEWLERLDPEEELTFGDVVGVYGGKVTKKTADADQVLVVSFKPLVLGNMPPAGQASFFEKVAFMGQVPVKVKGRVRKGDFLVPDGHETGVARAVSPETIEPLDIPHVLGVAWGESDANGLKFVKAAVGLKSGELARVMNRHAARLEDLENRVTRLESRLSLALAHLNASLPESDLSVVREIPTRRPESSLAKARQVAFRPR